MVLQFRDLLSGWISLPSSMLPVAWIDCRSIGGRA